MACAKFISLKERERKREKAKMTSTAQKGDTERKVP
jgi:hypothetical protein